MLFSGDLTAPAIMAERLAGGNLAVAFAGKYRRHGRCLATLIALSAASAAPTFIRQFRSLRRSRKN